MNWMKKPAMRIFDTLILHRKQASEMVDFLNSISTVLCQQTVFSWYKMLEIQSAVGEHLSYNV